tara:strand:- start:558 stop:980 length:423 start_codon:yes stop_codon:yes gene_type:complete
MFDAGKAGKVGPDLGKQRRGHGDADTVDGRQINPGPAGQRLAGIEFDALLGPHARQLAQVHFVPSALCEQSLESVFALRQVPSDVVVHRKGLRQDKQVLFAPIAGERLHHILFTGLDAAVACQHLRIALAGDDRWASNTA